ncbi:MAG: hypothetical protein KDE19_13850, partial [Caldilineaceae bacterium]|nr:hypothetical protein [Caldilineaceae bacterium]
PQIEINVLGTVLTPTGRISATYSLNGGAEQPLSLGPDKRRLAQKNDFNAEINFSELITGGNTVKITATDHLSTTTSQVVSVNYTPGNSWPINYQANWATAGGNIQNLAQVIDGEWGFDGGGIRPVVLSYDRLIGIGEVLWRDYEVVVPVTIHGIDENGFDFPSSGPGVGLLLKWQGHYDRGGEQPDEGWRNFGALGWYRWARETVDSPIIAGMQMLAYRGNEVAVNPNEVPTFGTTYMMKMSAQSQGEEQPAYYRFKTWPANQPEPAAWDMETAGIKDEPSTGSLLLLAHHVDATFGTVTVRPLAAITSTIQTGTDGNGSIQVNPPKDSYSYGEEVELIANGSNGHVLERWGGDVSGTETPLRVKVTKDLSVTASFIIPAPSSVSASAQGNGQVKISPQKANYAYNELVTLTAIPDAGFQFTGWSGSLTGVQNPVTVRMRNNITVTASFEASAAPPISDDFRTCRLDESLWTKVDPKGDSTFAVNGEQLLITVPENSSHNLFTNDIFAPRLLQPTPNTDFVVEAKFDSPLTQRFQTQGIIIEQDDNDLLRWEFYSSGDSVHAYAASIADGVATVRANTIITVPNGAPMYMRVSRSGDTWVQDYSFDAQTWQTNVSYEYPFTVARSGVYGGNVDPTSGEPDTAPAHTAIIDYFFNTAARIDPEDGGLLTLTTNVSPVGSGSVAKSPEKVSYGCDEAITLTATAEEGFQFAGWSGAVTSGENPLTGFTLRSGDTITASFIEAPPNVLKIYLPIVNR